MNKLSVLTIVTLLAGLAGCGGGGGGGGDFTASPPPPPPPPPPPTSGIGRTGLAVGPITNFGSIIVNGVKYETDSTVFTNDDEPGSESDLAVGDMVVVVGTIDDNGTTGTADQVFFDDAVTGPVQSIDPTGSSLVVLGQTVFVTADTSFDDSFSPASLDGVSVDQIVEVTGQFDANGDIVATRLEPKPAGSEYEVHGNVAALDDVNFTFTLGSLEVDYSNAMLDDFPGGQISNGDLVEAKGTSLSASGALEATKVELETFLPGVDEGDRLEIEGFITRFASAEDFDVAGQPVTTTSSTLFEGGSAADLGLNIKVEVEGDIDANGVLVATEVDIRRAKAVRATAVIDSVDSAAGSFVILDITVKVDELTRIEDKSDARVEPLEVGDLNVGDYVEVRGDEFPAGSGEILATILEREDPDTETILQGFVEDADGVSRLSILGVTVGTSAGTIFRDENDVLISGAEFFNRLEVGDLVKAEGLESGDATITAEEVEFELEF